MSFYDGDDESRRSKKFYVEANAARKVSLNAESGCGNGEDFVQVSEYYVTRYMGTGLPKSDNRELPATPQEQRISAQAEIVLAFPVTRDNRPLLEPQSVFALFTVRKTLKVSYGRNL